MDSDIKEKDVDMEQIRIECEGKTASELDAEFELFKKQFMEEHKKD